MNTPLKVEFRIGEIEFKAEGDPADVEKQRESFVNILLPLAVDAMVQTRGAMADTQYIEATEQPKLIPGQIEDIPRKKAEQVLNVDNCLSLNEFLNSKGFASQIETAIGLIYYYENVKGCIDFSTDELKRYFRDAKIKVPVNTSDVVNRLVTKSFVMQADEKGRYKLTRSGEIFVELYVAFERKDKKVKPRKARTKVESIYASLSADDLNLKSYPEIKSQDSFKKQMMLTLYIVNNEGRGDAFSTDDVQCLMTDKLGLPATEKQVRGVFDRNRTWFKSEVDDNNKKAFKYKLLSGAKDFAKSIIDGTIEK